MIFSFEKILWAKNEEIYHKWSLTCECWAENFARFILPSINVPFYDLSPHIKQTSKYICERCFNARIKVAICSCLTHKQKEISSELLSKFRAQVMNYYSFLLRWLSYGARVSQRQRKRFQEAKFNVVIRWFHRIFIYLCALSPICKFQQHKDDGNKYWLGDASNKAI